MDDRRDQLRSTIGAVLVAARAGDDSRTLDELQRLAELADPLEAAVWELAEANVDMLLTLADQPSDEIALGLELRDGDGEQLSIDELDPPQRTAVRIMLALAHGQAEDAETQLDIVGRVGDSSDVGLVLVHMLAWTLELLRTCEMVGKPIPSWLPDASAAGPLG